MIYLLALKTWGTRQQSASVISSPTQYFPAHPESSFSTALNPRVIQCCAHSFFFSSPTWIRTIRFWRGWIPEDITWNIDDMHLVFWYWDSCRKIWFYNIFYQLTCAHSSGQYIYSVFQLYLQNFYLCWNLTRTKKSFNFLG